MTNNDDIMKLIVSASDATNVFQDGMPVMGARMTVYSANIWGGGDRSSTFTLKRGYNQYAMEFNPSKAASVLVKFLDLNCK